MTKTYCDVCGEEMTEGVFAKDHVQNGSPQDVAGVSDVCKRCHIYGSRISPRKVLLEYWRQMVGVSIIKEDTDG